MKKVILVIAGFLITAGISIAAEQAVQPNPFERYDKDLKKLEEKKTKAKDEKAKKGMDSEIKKVNEQKDKALKKLMAPLEKEKGALSAEIDKMKAKDKNADVTAKQARLDYIDKMIQYYQDLSTGKTAEMPKDPSKVKTTFPADKEK